MCYKNGMKNLWLFDFDGVIADSLFIFEEIVIKSLKALGHNFVNSKQDFLDLFKENLYVSFAKKKIPQEDLKKLFAEIESKTDFSSIRLYSGIIDAVKKIGLTDNVAIVSSNREVQIEAILRANRSIQYFPLILGVNAGISKVEKIKKAVLHYKSDLKNTYYVVDTEGDLKEANEAKVNSVAVGWGWHNKADLSKHNPKFFVPTPADLVKLASEQSRK